MNVVIPAALTEQNNITDFFQQLDTLNTQHQQKHEKLLNLKKSMLNKMFPKEGEETPEIRFEGFSERWEEKELGNKAEIITGGTPSTSIFKYWNPKEIPWMSSGEVNKKRVRATDNLISQEGYQNSSANWVTESSILIALAGQGKTRGMVAVNEIPLTTNQSIAAIIPEESVNHEFLFQNLGKRYKEIRMKSSGDGVRGGLNKRIISEIKIPITNPEEQKKIGNLFKSLDSLLSQHRTQIEKIYDIKKACLEKMFV